MAKTITVNVTAEDIANGRRGNCWHCAVAIAMSRAFAMPVHVGMQFASDGGMEWMRMLPMEVVRKIRHLDSTGQCEPFDFQIRGLK